MYQLILLLVIIVIGYSQPISSNDPIYIFLRQNFRKTHNIHLYVKPYPFDKKYFDGVHFSMQNYPGYIRFAPSINISTMIPDFRSGTWISGRSEKVSFLAEPVLVNKHYGETVLGETYTRAGFTGRFENAIIQYNLPNANFQFGRAPIWWGQSWESSIIISGDSPPFDHFSTQLSFGRFNYYIFAGQLHSSIIDSVGRFKRFIGGKKLTFISKDEKLLLSMGDLILYTGINRSIEMSYLNPFVPSFFTAPVFENEIERYPFDGVDNDNSMIFFEGRYNYKSNLSSFFEFLIDDFQIDIENRDNVVDALGLKLGMDGEFDLFTNKLGFELEYTRISGYTYITRGWFTNWEDRSIPIGYRFGPDCQSIFLLLERWITTDYLISLRYTYLEKGELTLNSEYDPYGKVNNSYPSGNVRYYSNFKPSILWRSNSSIVEIGWGGDLNRNTKGSFYIKAQIVMGLKFNL